MDPIIILVVVVLFKNVFMYNLDVFNYHQLYKIEDLMFNHTEFMLKITLKIISEQFSIVNTWSECAKKANRL